MTFWEHLGELRTRLMRAIAYLAVAGLLGWGTYPFIDHVLVAPTTRIFAAHEIPLIYTSFTQPFFLRFQVALISGIVFALPLLSSELWGFISPALLPHERKWVYFVGPLSVLFFALGVLAGYLVMAPATTWFLGYLPKGEHIYQNVPDFIVFECKCILAFGLVFQLPVVLMFLALVGIVRSEMLKEHWRHAVCLLTVVAAVVTPSNDPVTMLAMAIPLVLLYILSIFLVGVTERMSGRARTASHPAESDSLLSG